MIFFTYYCWNKIKQKNVKRWEYNKFEVYNNIKYKIEII